MNLPEEHTRNHEKSEFKETKMTSKRSYMSGLFYEDAYREDFPLMSLATGVVMPEETSEQLIDAQCLGAARIKLLLL